MHSSLKKLFLRLLLPDLTRGKKIVSVKSLVRLAALYKGIFREEMAAAGEALRVSCQFCGEEYAFTPEEVLKLRRAEKEN